MKFHLDVAIFNYTYCDQENGFKKPSAKIHFHTLNGSMSQRLQGDGFILRFPHNLSNLHPDVTIVYTNQDIPTN